MMHTDAHQVAWILEQMFAPELFYCEKFLASPKTILCEKHPNAGLTRQGGNEDVAKCRLTCFYPVWFRKYDCCCRMFNKSKYYPLFWIQKGGAVSIKLDASYRTLYFIYIYI